MGENTWVHIGIAAVPALMIFGFWLETKRSNEARHRENSEKLAKLEVMMEPIWKWFNNGRSRD